MAREEGCACSQKVRSGHVADVEKQIQSRLRLAPECDELDPSASQPALTPVASQGLPAVGTYCMVAAPPPSPPRPPPPPPLQSAPG